MINSSIEKFSGESHEEKKWGVEVEDSYDYVEVVKNTYGFSQEKIKTCYLNPCVGVVIYNPNEKLAGIIHIKESRNMSGAKKDLTKFINEMKSKSSSWNQDTIEVHVLGGWEDMNLHGDVKKGLNELGITTKNIKTDVYTPHEWPTMLSLEGGSMLGESSPISVMFDPKQGTIHKITGDLYKSKITDTGNIFNILWIGNARKTPDKRSL